MVLFHVAAMRPGTLAAKDLKRDEVRTLTVSFHQVQQRVLMVESRGMVIIP